RGPLTGTLVTRKCVDDVMSMLTNISIKENDDQQCAFTLEKAPDFLGLAGKSPEEGRAVLVGKPSEDDTGEYEIIIKATDNGQPQKSSQQQFTLAVSVGNVRPIFESQPVEEVNVNEHYSYAVRSRDPDEDKLNLTASQSG